MTKEGFDFAGGDRVYAEVFAEHDLDVTARLPEEIARRIRSAPVRTRLVAALDNWAYVKDRLRADSGEAPRAVARLADDDDWRQALRDPAVQNDRARLKSLARQGETLAQPPANMILLARALLAVQEVAAAERLLGLAQQRHPDDFWANFDLACVLGSKPESKDQAIGFFRAALALQPRSEVVHNNLGVVLNNLGKSAEAEAEYRAALEIKSDYAEAYNNLGAALDDQGKPAEAEAAYRTALRLKPDFAETHNNLGMALHDQGKLAEAEAECRTALRIKPDLAEAHGNLAAILSDQGKPTEAEAECRTAVRLKPDYADGHNNLGKILHAQGRLAEAEKEFRAAVRIKPDYAVPYTNLGNVLDDEGKRAEAEREYRTSLRLKPDYAEAHFNLGVCLRAQGKLAEAEAEYRAAVRLKPDHAGACCNLGLLLRQQGRFAESLPLLRRGHDLGSRTPGWRYPSAQWVRETKTLADLDARLPKILQGDDRPKSAAERIQLAQICQMAKQLTAAAARFYTDAFAEQPKLAEEMNSHRYNAACAAALAGLRTGQGRRGTG